MRTKTGSTNYSITIKGKRYLTNSIRRFLKHVRTINWPKHPSVYLRVSYGTQLDYHNKPTAFFNDGDYNNKHDFNMALNAFLET